VYRRYPWLGFNLFSAFVKAKAIAQENLADSIPSGFIFGKEYFAKTREIFGADPFPYGINQNGAMLETIIEYSHEQGLTPKKSEIEDLFAPSTVDL
jgi:4,5-dihydroxyphthalate decarboxylase